MEGNPLNLTVKLSFSDVSLTLECDTGMATI